MLIPFQLRHDIHSATVIVLIYHLYIPLQVSMVIWNELVFQFSFLKARPSKNLQMEVETLISQLDDLNIFPFRKAAWPHTLERFM